MRTRLPVMRSSWALSSPRWVSVSSRGEVTSARAKPRRSSTIRSKLVRMAPSSAMRRWSIRTKRKLRAMGESWSRSAMRPTTARLRLPGTAGVVSAFSSSREAARALSKARSWLRAASGLRSGRSSGRRPPAAVVTSASALAYRVATAESVISIYVVKLRLQSTYEPLYESVFGVGRHAGADLLFGQPHGEFGGIPLQSHARGLAGGSDFPFGMSLNLGDFRLGLVRHALRLSLGLGFTVAAQRRDILLQVGQAAVHVGGLGFGILTLAQGFVHVLADARRTRGEKGPGVLADEVTQHSGEQQEIHPLKFEFVLFGEAFFFFDAGFLLAAFVLLGQSGTAREGQAERYRDHRQPPHAAFRRRMVSAIWLASDSLSAARPVLATSTSAASCVLATLTAAPALFLASATAAASRSCSCLSNCSCAWYSAALAVRKSVSYRAVLAAACSRLCSASLRAPSVAS